jgi:hypothetical protein
MTDFTYKEGAVCAMYGVVKSVDKTLDIIDGTHELPKFDTWSASYRIWQSYKFWPKGTVFVLVVDPGVGTHRRACVAKTADGFYVVSPDNGSLSHLKKLTGIAEVREIDETKNRLRGKDTDSVSVFHGRDLFGYCGAKLASGQITFDEVGKPYPVEEIIGHPISEPRGGNGVMRGIIEISDPNFGNSWTNIPLNDFQAAGFRYGDTPRVTIENGGQTVFDQAILFHQSFGCAGKGQPVIYNNELNRIALAVNQGSFMDAYGVGFGTEWTITFRKDTSR